MPDQGVPAFDELGGRDSAGRLLRAGLGSVLNVTRIGDQRWRTRQVQGLWQQVLADGHVSAQTQTLSMLHDSEFETQSKLAATLLTLANGSNTPQQASDRCCTK